MASNSFSTYDKRLYEIADEYRQRGYKVTIAPSAKQLPEFLTGFRPDIVAESSNESVVIELKTLNKTRPTDYWSELSTVVQQHPGWRFELIIGNNTKRQPPETITRNQVKSLLQEGQRLAKEKMFHASLLITWSAAEAAMRLASKDYDVDLPDFRPATIISKLYEDGVLEREDYSFLLDCMKIRNAVAHGFRGETIKPYFIKRLHKIALRLLEK